MAPSIITLTTDFGTSDSYVAQMKGTILSVNPDVKIIDVTHDIPPQDIAAGAYELAQMWQVFPVGTVHIAVVDPGVGTDRAIIAARCNDHFFVLPDNGLLSRVLESTSLNEVVEVQNRSFMQSDISNTFHGRDVMGPVAAHISLGIPLAELGQPASEVVRFELPTASCGKNEITAEIIHIDHFGNLISNITLRHLQGLPLDQVKIECLGQSIKSVRETYGTHSAGSFVALVGSKGYLEIAVVDGNASQQLEASRGDSIRLSW